MKAESKRSVRIMLQWLLSAATVLMAALLIWQCVTIYHEGIAPENMGENGLRIHDIYSREIVTAHFASIAWSVWVFLALLAACRRLLRRRGCSAGTAPLRGHLPPGGGALQQHTAPTADPRPRLSYGLPPGAGHAGMRLRYKSENSIA